MSGSRKIGGGEGDPVGSTMRGACGGDCNWKPSDVSAAVRLWLAATFVGKEDGGQRYRHTPDAAAGRVVLALTAIIHSFCKATVNTFFPAAISVRGGLNCTEHLALKERWRCWLR